MNIDELRLKTSNAEIYLTTAEVAEIFKVSRTTVWKFLRDKKWKGIKIGNKWRVTQTEVDRIKRGYYNFIESQK